MKSNISLIIIIIFSTALSVSCSRSMEKKITGTWKVEDVKFDSSKPLDPAVLESSRESAKTVRYALMEDKTAKIHAGSAILEGSWIFREAESGVYMVFKDSFDTVLIGRYEEGKLINVATRPDIKITTIFYKEE